MHAAQSPLLAVISDISLRNDGFHAVRLELMLTKDPGEKPSLILGLLKFDDERAFEFCFLEDHALNIRQMVRLSSTLESE